MKDSLLQAAGAIIASAAHFSELQWIVEIQGESAHSESVLQLTEIHHHLTTRVNL